jgi:hypothetical protein
MSTSVSGSLRLLNGQVPNLNFELNGILKIEKEDVEWQCRILGGHFIVEFPNWPTKHQDDDEIFRVAQTLIDNMILCPIVDEGVGLSYTLEHCKKWNGEIILKKPDQAPQIEDIQIDRDRIFNLIGGQPELRYAIRDFNQGLLDRENCPILFYRAIETLAKLFTNKEKLEAKDWNTFHLKLHTERSDMETLKRIADNHRHGTHIYFTKDEHLIMMRTVRYFLMKSIAFLLSSQDND